MRRTKTTRTIELVIERHESFGARKFAKPTVYWCEQCRRNAPFLPLAEAALVSGASLQEITRRIKAAEVHFIETRSETLVCLALGGGKMWGE